MPILAIFIWPPIATIFFAQMTFARALVVSTLVGYLLLPEQFSIDLPGLPAVDKKFTLTAGMVLSLMLFSSSRKQTQITLENKGVWLGRLIKFALVVVMIAPVLTFLDNRSPVFAGPTVLQALRPWDLLSITLETLYYAVPFLLARRYLATPDMHRMVLKLLVTAGLLYSIFIMIEIRFSPQLNFWVYGYYQSSFVQHIRDGGFRPMVFLKHGLWVGFFLFTLVIAALALYRSSTTGERTRYLLAGLWLFGVLLVSKNVGALGIAFLMAAALFLPRVWQMRAILAVVIPFLFYPVVRQAGLVPTEQIMSVANSISEGRAQSFQYRLDNEDELLARALKKPAFGWGGWGRGLIYNEKGEKISTSDGTWIIVLGTFGWVGYLSFFTLLTLPLLALWHAKRRKDIPIETMAIALITTGNIIYLIPNSAISPIGWLMAGALAGFVQFDRVAQDSPEVQPASRKSRTPRYTRFALPKEDQSVRPRSPHRRSTSNP